MRYLNMSFVDAMDVANHINGRNISAFSQRGAKWFWYPLPLHPLPSLCSNYLKFGMGWDHMECEADGADVEAECDTSAPSLSLIC